MANQDIDAELDNLERLHADLVRATSHHLMFVRQTKEKIEGNLIAWEIFAKSCRDDLAERLQRFASLAEKKQKGEWESLGKIVASYVKNFDAFDKASLKGLEVMVVDQMLKRKIDDVFDKLTDTLKDSFDKKNAVTLAARGKEFSATKNAIDKQAKLEAAQRVRALNISAAESYQKKLPKVRQAFEGKEMAQIVAHFAASALKTADEKQREEKMDGKRWKSCLSLLSEVQKEVMTMKKEAMEADVSPLNEVFLDVIDQLESVERKIKKEQKGS